MQLQGEFEWYGLCTAHVVFCIATHIWESFGFWQNDGKLEVDSEQILS